jgi:hypothetical protein
MNFQTFVGTQPSPAVAGDKASANPRFSVDAGPGGLVAGPNGVIVGRFAWWNADQIDPNGAPALVNNFGSGPVTGFVPREQQGLITVFLQQSSMLIPTGFMMTLMSGGDFWCVNDGTSDCTVGMKAYANFADGRITFAATGTPNGATSTSYTIAAETASFTGTIIGDILTASAVTGLIVPGEVLSGTNVQTGTTVLAQVLPLLAGEALLGAGRYEVNFSEQNVASTAITGAYGLLTAGGTITGTFGVGDTLSGTGVTAGTNITALGTGTGGAGTYYVTPSQTASSGTITAATNVETKWVAMSAGLAGELVKISSQALG